MDAANQRISNCERSRKRCKSERGIIQHLQSCAIKDQQVGPPPTPPPLPPYNDQPTDHDILRNVPIESFWWDETKGSEVENEIDARYEKIVYWKKNLFMLPTGAKGRLFICEVTRLINAWT